MATIVYWTMQRKCEQEEEEEEEEEGCSMFASAHFPRVEFLSSL